MTLIISVTALAQPDSLWSRTFGGDSADYCYSVEQTSDGGYILAGYTCSFGAGGSDFWLVKTNESGDSLWNRTFGGSDDDRCYSVQQTSDGGYILAGSTDSFGAVNRDFWLVKTNANGDSLWSRIFGRTVWDDCYSVQQTSDGGYILAGHTFSFAAGRDDFWLVRTNANGDSLWTRTFGGSNDEVCWSVQQTLDGGYILAGETYYSFGAGEYDFWLVKTDADGDSLWSRAFGGRNYDLCHSAQQASDGGYVLAGWTDSFGTGGGFGVSDFWLVKTNANGDSLWSRTFAGRGQGSDDVCYSVQQTSDGGYILAGTAGAHDFWLVKTDANGDSLWSCTFGGDNWDCCFSVQQTSEGGYILAGWTGLAPWEHSADFWLVKTGPDVSAAESLVNPLPSEYTLCQNWPNPFNPTTQISYDLTRASHVSLKIFDLLGQEVRTLVNEMQSAGTHSVTFNGSELASGIYLYRLRAGGFISTKKMILLK